MYINGYGIEVIKEVVKLWADENGHVTIINIFKGPIKLYSIKMSDDTTDELIRTLVTMLDNPGIDNNNPDFKSYALNTTDIPLSDIRKKYSIVSFRDKFGINLTIIVKDVIDFKNNTNVHLIFDEQQLMFLIELLSQKRESIG